jgi:hypothetical protein
LKVAILTKSSLYLYVWVRLSKGTTEVRCSGRHYFTGGQKWKITQGLVPEVAGLQPRPSRGSSSALSGRREPDLLLTDIFFTFSFARCSSRENSARAAASVVRPEMIAATSSSLSRDNDVFTSLSETKRATTTIPKAD